MKNVSDKALAVMIFVCVFLLLLCVKSHGQTYDYHGAYSTQTILTHYCDDCYLELPPDFLKTEIVLSVSTSDTNKVLKALQTSAHAVGWELTKGKDGRLKARPLENVGNVVYISCMDKQPHNVPTYLYTASIESDKLLCRERDSLQALAREKAVIDSIRLDSSRAAKLDFANYQLRYYSYNKSFTDKLGVSWGSVLAAGNLHDKIKFFDDWQIIAQQTNDTTYTARTVEFSVDSLLSLDWGSEEQTLKQSFVNDGVTTSNYEWRKYGLLVVVKRDGRRVKMDYVFRDKDNSVSVLQGSVIGVDGDTLRLVGDYTLNRQVQTGVPFFSSIPVLGELFKTTSVVNDKRAFELYLLPKEPKSKPIADIKK